MKRRTRFALFTCALAGAFPLSTPVAHAVPVEPYRHTPSTVVLASDSPPKVVRVRTPLPKVTVALGDTLSSIGARTHRTWPALASFNHIPNPDLILVGQMIVIPPASYAPPVVLPATPQGAPPSSPVVLPTPARVYTPPDPAPVVRYAPGSFQACVAFRESTNGAGSSNIYGILPSTWASLGLAGSPYSASRAQQDAAFQTLYARDGTQPWAPYDGC